MKLTKTSIYFLFKHLKEACSANCLVRSQFEHAEPRQDFDRKFTELYYSSQSKKNSINFSTAQNHLSKDFPAGQSSLGRYQGRPCSHGSEFHPVLKVGPRIYSQSSRIFTQISPPPLYQFRANGHL